MSRNEISTITKTFATRICVFLVPICLLSCGNAAMRRNLAVADSLTEANQMATGVLFSRLLEA
ncbi:MAG TPA: hypothetical protein H9966_01195 [Candidatus Prevotella avicola]|uniref:Uncharacterized protein n=1 Tax=Candidatus Prevotella avicola TaxID=2838738 RepID=A0A9D2JWH6_9BACT|nr:hypothetical protein [Candidatus Prevotella avicola]